MKTLKVFMGALLVGAVIFAGCKKDENKPGVKPDSDTDSTEVVLPDVDGTDGLITIVVKPGSLCEGYHILVNGAYGKDFEEGYPDVVAEGNWRQDADLPGNVLEPIADGWYKTTIEPLSADYVTKVKFTQEVDTVTTPTWLSEFKKDVTIVDGDAEAADGGDITFGASAAGNVVYITGDWNAKPCVEPEEYTLTVTGYEGDIYYAGGAFEIGWTPTLLPSNPFKFTAKPGEEFKIIADAAWTAFAKEDSYNAESNCYSDNNIVLESGKNDITINVLGVIDGETYVKCE